MTAEALERAVAARVGARHVVAVSSPEAGLRLAYEVLGVASGRLVWTSPLTPPAVLPEGVALGFVDVEPRTYNLSLPALAEKLEGAERHGALPMAVVVQDVAGHPAELRMLHDLGNRYGFYVVEDATAALGARYEDTPVGGSRFADVTVFGFGAVPGGVVTTARADWAQRLRALADGVPDAPAALSWVAGLDAELARREALVARYDAELGEAAPWRSPDHRSAWGAYLVRGGGGAFRLHPMAGGGDFPVATTAATEVADLLPT